MKSKFNKSHYITINSLELYNLVTWRISALITILWLARYNFHEELAFLRCYLKLYDILEVLIVKITSFSLTFLYMLFLDLFFLSSQPIIIMGKKLLKIRYYKYSRGAYQDSLYKNILNKNIVNTNYGKHN